MTDKNNKLALLGSLDELISTLYSDGAYGPILKFIEPLLPGIRRMSVELFKEFLTRIRTGDIEELSEAKKSVLDKMTLDEQVPFTEEAVALMASATNAAKALSEEAWTLFILLLTAVKLIL